MDRDDDGPTPVKLVADPDTPIACTLDAVDVPARIEAWSQMLDGATARVPVGVAGMRVDFAIDVDLDGLTQLIADELACCAFLTFAVTITPDFVSLEVRAPDDGAEIVHELFG